jgi:UDP-2,3-diacylglucosamine hydrolase
MTDEYLFISDCHLDANRQDITDQLADFLQNRATEARFLYVLGDLFEAWIGDDDPAEALSDIFHCFQELARHTEIYFLAGNRDFLFGDTGARRMGARVIREPSIITLGGQKVALLHGDSMCTDDREYQKFRHMVRGQPWQSDFLHKPLSERTNIATGLRKQSKTNMQHKSMDIMDVNRQTVIESFAEFGVDTMIHGHTHQPAVHRYGENQFRYVLGDWNPQPSYLSWRQDRGFKLADHRV